MNPKNLILTVIDFIRLDRWVKRFQKQRPGFVIEVNGIWQEYTLLYNGQPFQRTHLRVMTVHGDGRLLLEFRTPEGYHRG